MMDHSIFLKNPLYNELDVSTGRTPILIAPLPEIKEWDGQYR